MDDAPNDGYSREGVEMLRIPGRRAASASPKPRTRRSRSAVATGLSLYLSVANSSPTLDGSSCLDPTLDREA